MLLLMQNSIYEIKYLLFLSWDWEAWCLTQSGGGNTPSPERNTAWNKGRKCFHCLGAPNNLIRPCGSAVTIEQGRLTRSSRATTQGCSARVDIRNDRTLFFKPFLDKAKIACQSNFEICTYCLFMETYITNSFCTNCAKVASSELNVVQCIFWKFFLLYIYFFISYEAQRDAQVKLHV